MKTLLVRRMAVLALACAALAVLAGPAEARRRCRSSGYHYYNSAPAGTVTSIVPVDPNAPQPVPGTTQPVPGNTQPGTTLPAGEADHVHCVIVLGTEDEALADMVKAGGQKVQNLFKRPG